MKGRTLLALFLFLSGVNFHLVAQEDTEQGNRESSGSKLEEINFQVEQETAAMRELESREKVVKGELKKLEGSILTLKEEEQRITAELNKVKREQSSIKEEVAQNSKEALRLEALAFKRLRALYMNHNQRTFMSRLLYLSHSPTAGRDSLYLLKVRSFDQELISKLMALNQERAKSAAALDKNISMQETLISKLDARKGSIQSKIRDQERFLVELRQQKKEREQHVLALRAQALRLETVVASLTRGEEDAVFEEREERPREVLEFDGAGLDSAKGKLLVPVKGSVLQRYGKYRHGDFDDIVFSKGIEFRTEPGSEVKAVDDGRVIFVGRMPAYGTVIILDHGKRSYSLYGRVSDATVNEGAVIEKGESMALTGPLDDKSRNFYFEIRKNGSPVNPQSYFKGKLG